ncbi:hypothetical protein San01_10210 [Streptomyces angustmyceticus]|uniref:Uncharacterized protein n=1 Tax=Streptomyces angustmyceticus TaxID=285578 RepID=A0A5J4L723_9ACTN|nr:hypothetical protein San01_10210 [Streptomyces angustmyceticus]
MTFRQFAVAPAGEPDFAMEGGYGGDDGGGHRTAPRARSARRHRTGSRRRVVPIGLSTGAHALQYRTVGFFMMRK